MIRAQAIVLKLYPNRAQTDSMRRFGGEWRWNNRGLFQTRLAALFGTKAGPLPLKELFA